MKCTPKVRQKTFVKDASSFIKETCGDAFLTDG